MRQRARPAAVGREAGASVAKPAATAKPKAAKLGFKDARELEQAPARIDALEAEQAELSERVSEPGVLQERRRRSRRACSRGSRRSPGEIERAYARWDELEALRQA